MTAPLTETVTTGTSASADERPTHVVCCDHNTALCGADTSAMRYVPVDTLTDCPLCALVEDMPCGNPDCPDRETPEDWA